MAMSLKFRVRGFLSIVSCRHVSRCLLIVLPFLLAGPAAYAGARDSKERAAKKACLSGDYAKGVSILSELYIDTDDLTYIFNQGRCFEQNGRYEDAINRFREYGRKIKDAGKAPDSDVERHIADCQALLGKEKAKPVEAEPATPPPQPVAPLVAPQATPPTAPPVPVAPAIQPAPEPGAATPVAENPAAQSEITQAAPAAPKPGSGLRIAVITTIAVGVAGVAAGVILNVKANSLSSELEKSPTSYQRSKESTRASYETLGWVGYGVGAACIAGGVILYYLGHSRGSNSQLALLPVASPGRLGAVLQGAF